jgi:hypothetical protein
VTLEHEELDGDRNVTIMFLDLGAAKAGTAFARAHLGASS